MIDEWYEAFNSAAYQLNEGKITDAENMMDCTVYMYYYRMVNKINYIGWHNEQLQKQSGK